MLRSLYKLIDEPNDLERIDGTMCGRQTTVHESKNSKTTPINIRRTIEKQLLFKTKRCTKTSCSRTNCPFVHSGEKAYARPTRHYIEAIVANEIYRLEQMSCNNM